MNRPHLATTSAARPGEWASDPRRHCAPGKAAPEIFFPESCSRYASHPAIQVCRHCPVRQDCADYAMAHPGLHGVWGGLTQSERDQIHRSTNLKGTA